MYTYTHKYIYTYIFDLLLKKMDQKFISKHFVQSKNPGILF